MINRTKYTAGVSNADLAAANAAISAASGSFDGMFSIPLIAENDADDLDPPRYWATVVKLTDSQRSVLKTALAGIGSLHYQEIGSKVAVEDEALIDAWAASYGYRRPGHIMESYGTATADGSAAAQDLTTSPSLLNQWTGWIKKINMDKDATSQRYELDTTGTYELGSRLPHVPVDGVTFYARAVRNATPVLGTLDITEDIDGKVEGPLTAGNKVGIVVWASEPASFKLSAGAKIRLKRTA